MSIRHEQLKQNVTMSRERLDHARAKRLESAALHKRHRVLNIVFWTVAPVSALVMSLTFAWWVLLIWAVAFGITTRMAWKDLITARDDVYAWRERELENLSDVTDDIQALVERETLQLMDSERYAELEDAAKRIETRKATKSKDKWKRMNTEILRKEEEYRKRRADKEAARVAKHTQRNAVLEEYTAEYRRDMARKIAAEAGVPQNLLTNNQYVTYTRVTQDGWFIQERINLDTGEVEVW